MALINRITRLIKSDFHAVLDQIEEPEQVLKQAIRDMEDELVRSKQILANGIQENKALNHRIDEIRTGLIEQKAELDLCFDNKEEQLARGLIRKKLETERWLQRLESIEVSQQQFLEEQQRLCEQQESSFEQLKQKSELFNCQPADNGKPSGINERGWSDREVLISNDEVEIAFLKEKESRRAS